MRADVRAHTCSQYLFYFIFICIFTTHFITSAFRRFLCAMSNAEGEKSEMTTHKPHVDSPLITTAITSLVECVFYQREEIAFIDVFVFPIVFQR